MATPGLAFLAGVLDNTPLVATSTGKERPLPVLRLSGAAYILFMAISSAIKAVNIPPDIAMRGNLHSCLRFVS